MCNIKAPININNVKIIILVRDIVIVMSFLHHNTRSLSIKRQGPTKLYLYNNLDFKPEQRERIN